MIVNIRPLDDRILVRRLPAEPPGGLVAPPDCATAPSLRGVVVAVGPGKRGKKGRRIPCDVKPGDVVLFGKYTDFEEDDLVMIQEGDVRYVECQLA